MLTVTFGRVVYVCGFSFMSGGNFNYLTYSVKYSMNPGQSLFDMI